MDGASEPVNDRLSVGSRVRGDVAPTVADAAFSCVIAQWRGTRSRGPRPQRGGMSTRLSGRSCDGRVTRRTHPGALQRVPFRPRIVACLLASPHPFVAPLVDVRGATLRLFDDRRALLACARSGSAAAIVVDLHDADGRPTNGTVRAVRIVAPSLPVFARCRLVPHDCRLLLDFARAGGTDVLVDGNCDALVAALAPRAARTTAAIHRAIVERLVAAGLPHSIVPLLDALLTHVDDPGAVDRAAAALGTSRRGFERRLVRAALPPPRALQIWCRLLVAAERLAGDDAVERIAHDVGFSSANALRNAMQRYAGATPTAIRDGGVDRLVTRFREAHVRAVRSEGDEA